MHIELRVRDILSSPSRLKDKVHRILEELKVHPEGSDAERGLLKFLLNSGHYTELLHHCEESLEKQKTIPWDLLLSTLVTTNQLPQGKSNLKSIEKGVERQKASGLLWAVTGLDEILPWLAEARKSIANSLHTQMNQKKSELMEKFEFLRSQHLAVEARKVLRHLRAAFPQDPEISALETNFEESWAREVLSERASDMTMDSKTLTHFQHTKEDAEFLQFWLAEALTLVENDPHKDRDLAMFFLFLEAPEMSLRVLERSGELSYSLHWLKAELLRRSRRYIEALEEASVIEQLGAQHPDSTFAVTYFKAEVYGDLGRYDQALQLLESVARIRPNYRSTSYLINQWRNRGSDF